MSGSARAGLLVAVIAAGAGLASAQQSAPAAPAGTQQPAPPAAPAPPPGNYVVGPLDALVITFYDEPELTGKFTVETDGTFTYPLIGRVRAGGLTLREVEATLEQALVERGFYKDPQLAVSIETYRSQRVYVVGEVRSPGAYSMSGTMRLVEALALAGSTTPTASGEAVIVHATNEAIVVDPNTITAPAPGADSASSAVTRVDLRELENGDISQNVALRNGDTIFVLRAENVYVFGQVKSPGAYPLRQKNTTVLQALALAGGVTDRGATGRVQIVRIVDGKRLEIRAELTDFVQPRDTIMVPERFF